MNTLELLDRLIAFPTVSRDPNRELVDFVRDMLTGLGVASELYLSEGGRKANLFATLGPADRPGIMLSGHTDVVPTDGQAWSGDPFRMRLDAGRAYGRGATDMKGFVACGLRLADLASRQNLSVPIHLALSHDEEIGCVGVRSMIDGLATRSVRPRFAIVGEPTRMQIAVGHKGKIAARATCCGVEAHSALAPLALNAIHLACDFVGIVRGRQAAVELEGARDSDYDVPYTTLHVGRIDGGTALNIVPNRCTIDFEIRNVAEESAEAILQDLVNEAARLIARRRPEFPQADLRIEVLNAYPGLATSSDAEVVRFARGLIPSTALCKVAFGTEGGLFSDRLGIPTVVCGPGSMEQGHKPDEFIALEQLDACDRMMDRLLQACR